MPTRLRIATFNLEDLGGATAGGPSLDERVAALRPMLVGLDADLLCLQEVNAQDAPAPRRRTLTALDRVLDGTPYEGFRRIASSGPSGERLADKHNLVVLSRWPIVASRQVRHDLLPPLSYIPVTADPVASGPIDLGFDRPLLQVTASLPNGRSLHVLNLHLKAPLAIAIPGQKRSPFVWKSIAGWAEGFYLASLKRAGQALEARLCVDRLFDENPDAFIAVYGDFNADRHEVPVRVILGSEGDTGNATLAPRVLSALDDKLPEHRRYSVLHAGRGVMLDHILVSRSLLTAWRDAAVFSDRLVDEAVSFAARIRPADSLHAPMCAEFQLPD